MTLVYIILGIAVVLVVWVIATYNFFVRLVNRTKEAWADIDVQLKRRYDLIPNLVNTVQGYAKHEKETLAQVTEMRTKAMQAEGVAEKGKAENMLSDALKSLFAVAESYPDLKANENFLELQRELTDTENKIQAARRFYNTNVRDLKIGLESFPQSIVANMFSIKDQPFFELDESEEAAREPVNVSF